MRLVAFEMHDFTFFFFCFFILITCFIHDKFNSKKNFDQVESSHTIEGGHESHPKRVQHV